MCLSPDSERTTFDPLWISKIKNTLAPYLSKAARIVTPVYLFYLVASVDDKTSTKGITIF